MEETDQAPLTAPEDPLTLGPEHGDEILPGPPGEVLERDEDLVEPADALGLVVVRRAEPGRVVDRLVAGAEPLAEAERLDRPEGRLAHVAPARMVGRPDVPVSRHGPSVVLAVVDQARGRAVRGPRRLAGQADLASR